MAPVNEIRLGRRATDEKLGNLLVKGLIALAVLWIVLMLPGCGDSEYERLQAEAEFNAKVAHAALPKKGELVTIRQYADGRYVVRKYDGGLKETYMVTRDE